MSEEKAIKEFKINEKELSAKEKLILDKVILAAKLTAPLYLYQKNDKYPGANFYPHDASKKEIESAARKNPLILDPYTFVEREKKTRKLIAVPFHQKFKKELKPIAKLLREAAELSEDKNFSQYLKNLARVLVSGDYQKIEILWVKYGVSKFGFILGPIERYIDKLFFKKCAFQSWVGILDQEKTKEAEKLKKAITNRRRILPGSEKVSLPRLTVRVDKTALFSGLIADFAFTGTNLPNDVHLMEKYGSKLTVFETSLDSKFKDEHYPTFQEIFQKSYQQKYTKKELYEGSFKCILLHEISHSLIRYEDAEERLKEIFPVLDEVLAYVLGVDYCGTLFLKGVISQKELEAVLVMHICRHFMWWIDSFKNPSVIHYLTGAAMALNFYSELGGIKEKNGISFPDFSKLLLAVKDFSHLLEYYLALGSYEEAKDFIQKYSSFDIFKRFSSKLSKIIKKN